MVKHISSLFAWGTIVTTQVLPLHGATASAAPSATPTQDNVRFVGAVTCQSSMCHGGASPSRNQYTIWSHQDFHSHSYATLVTAQSQQIAKSVGIDMASESVRCTVCHAPMAGLPPSHLATAVEGVSCESCHNGAAAWLRGHTRYDWTYADRIHAGLRDLRDAYVRAETCVKCHQVIDDDLIKAGHPALTFEMDGQSVAEPKHWREKEDWFGPKAWLVGQAVALKEICLQSKEKAAPNSQDQAKALVWLLQKVPGVYVANVPSDQAPALAAWSNQTAETISSAEWNAGMSGNALTALAGTSQNFTDNTVPLPEQKLRAQRLVLGLDRLFKSLHSEANPPGQAELTALFGAVGDLDQFNPASFSKLLQKFNDAVTKK